VREEVISEKFAQILGRLAFGDEVLSWVTKALRDSHADEQKDHEAAITRLQAEHDRLQQRLHAMYVDKLDGRIDRSFYAQMSEQWQLEQDKLKQEIIRHQAADRSYLNEGVRLIELAHGAQHLFVKQEPREQRRLLNCTFELDLEER
jgi:site-specific DNA recombinase